MVKKPGESQAEYIKRLVGEAPPLTEAQVERLAALLRPFGSRPRTEKEGQ